MLLALVLLIPILLYLYNTWAFGYWQRRGAFQIEGKFIFGNIKEVFFFKKSLEDFTTEIYKKFKEKKIIGFYSFYKPMVLVADPSLVKQVLINDFAKYSGAGFEIDFHTDPLLSMNPFSTCDFESWKERRAIQTSLHTPSKLKFIPEIIFKVGHSMTKYITECKDHVVQVKDLAELFTMDSVVSTAYGMEPTAYTDPDNIFLKNARKIFSPSVAQSINSAFLYPKIGSWLKARNIAIGCEKFFVSLTPQLINLRETDSSLSRGDMVDIIIKTNKKRTSEGKKALSEMEQVAHITNTYLDSFFTTSIILRFFLQELASYPDIQEKLREEIHSTGKKLEDFDLDKIKSLKYLQMTLNETLRLHPVLPILARVCTKDTELGGVRMEKGVKLLIPAVCLHMDPDLHHEPHLYRPERFANPEDTAHTLFLAFGEGPRMCLGKTLHSQETSCPIPID